MDSTVLLKYSVISVKDMSITQSLRKILTNLELALPNTHQMSLPTMSKLRQNKIGGVFFRFFNYRVLVIMQTSCHPASTEGRSDVKTTRVGVDI